MTTADSACIEQSPPISEQGIVELDWEGNEDVVRVRPKDETRFNLHKKRVIKILQLTNSADLEIQLLMVQIAQWIRENSGKLRDAFLTVRDERLLFVAVSRSVECDEELEDSISDLDLKLANDDDLKVLRVNTLILPPASPDALESFIDRRFLMVYRVAGS